jgi:hypothetical protein
MDLSTSDNTYANWVIKLALGTPSVMDALFSFSAFHFHILNEDKKIISRLIQIHNPGHIPNTLRTSVISSGITPDNTEVCFATSILIVFHTASSYHLLCDEEAQVVPILLPHWFCH